MPQRNKRSGLESSPHFYHPISKTQQLFPPSIYWPLNNTELISLIHQFFVFICIFRFQWQTMALTVARMFSWVALLSVPKKILQLPNDNTGKIWHTMFARVLQCGTFFNDSIDFLHIQRLCLILSSKISFNFIRQCNSFIVFSTKRKTIRVLFQQQLYLFFPCSFVLKKPIYSDCFIKANSLSFSNKKRHYTTHTQMNTQTKTHTFTFYVYHRKLSSQK